MSVLIQLNGALIELICMFFNWISAHTNWIKLGNSYVLISVGNKEVKELSFC